MSDQGYTVDHQEMVTCVSRLTELREHAAGIINLAADANPEWYIWGALGAPMAAVYWQFAGELYQHLEQMGKALDDRIDALDHTAQNYQGADDTVGQSVQKIERLLD
ncbi:MAG TPA: hypothetical protein VFX70_07190 [Mycobacteriales bacterium]|nr:hypothetical protein [Mycobacteriales bacterium]